MLSSPPHEAGNHNAFTPQVVAEMIRATVPRLRELGFPTMIQFPESINVAVAMRYIEALQGQADLWPGIGLIAYHLYGNNDRLAELREFAFVRGLPTAQTEFMNLTIDNLYTDLTVGGCSYWEIYGLASPDYATIEGGISSDSFRGGPHYWRFRQVSHYVRPGAVRVEATCTDPALRALAFDHDGRVTVVFINTGQGAQERAVTVGGLPPGMYGVCRTVGAGPYEERQAVEVAADGRARLSVAADSVCTLYPRTEENLAPTLTSWRARPGFLHVPQDTVTLQVAATDPDLDELRCAWRVIAQPEGAHVRIAEPTAASTQASGPSVPGDYVFAVTVSDGANSVEKRLMVRIFGENQPPVPVDVHNRIPVRVTVADGKTELRGGAGRRGRCADCPLEHRQPAAGREHGAGHAHAGQVRGHRPDGAGQLRLPLRAERPDAHGGRGADGAGVRGAVGGERRLSPGAAGAAPSPAPFVPLRSGTRAGEGRRRRPPGPEDARSRLLTALGALW